MKKRVKKFIGKLIYVPAIFIPLMTIPQVLKIWLNKSAQDISLVS